MLNHKFTVSETDESPSHEITVKVPSFAEATAKQRENLYNEGMKSVTIKVQGTCRRRLGKGIRGEALRAEAQAAFDAIVNGTSNRAPSVVIDAKVAKLNKEQIAYFESQGATVINKPEPKSDKPAE